MSPRGRSIGARTSSRKSFAFFWAALFIVSIALQYAQLSKPSPVDAASGLLADTVAGFEIDGNLKGSDAHTNPGSIPAALIHNPPMADAKDWLDPSGVADPDGTDNPSTFLFEDATGSGDHSAYAGGNKEDDTRDWDYVNAAGPNDKTDFKHIMAHAEVIGNSTFAFLGAERIVNNGTMVVDFELNKKKFKVYPSPVGNNVPKPDRSNGDLLISLEYSNGGSNPIVTIYAVANVQNFPSGQTNTFVQVSDAKVIDAVRSATNFADLPDQGFGYTIPAFDFAEASIDLAKLDIGPACPGFSTGHIRSRTGGDPGSSQLKDTARNFDIDLNNCGTVTIVKNAVPNDPQDFSFTTDGTVAGGAPLADFKLDNDGDDGNTLSKTKTFLLVPPGDYTVTETPVDRWKLTGLTCVEDKVDNSSGNINTGVASIDVQPNENVTCTFTNTKQKNNPAIVTSANQTGVVVGTNISDSATLSGGFSPTGTITFRAYGPSNPTCAGAAAFTSDPVAVNGNGTYGPVTYAAQGVGTYLWIATYSGDDENNGVAGTCGDAGETDTTIKDSPTISTVASANITIGGTISDTATLADGFNPTGTITFNLYGPNDATCATSIFTTTKTVNGNGSYTSATFPPVATGTYRWIASYGGDANNNAVSGACNDANESVVVSPATPGISTSAAEPAIVIGNAVHDTAVLSGAVNPTGSITFNLYGPNDATCTGVVAFTTSLAVTANGSYGPVQFTPTAVGTYRWIASYSGDGNNSPITGLCNDAGENDTVIPASPAIVTTANQSVVVGNPISDTATLSGGVTPTGTITFNAYSTADCSGVAVFTTSLPVAGNGAYGPVGFTPATVGVYHWIASYGGDAKNNPIAGVCGDAGENDTVTPAVPAIATTANETSVVIGGDIHDTATLSGGVAPTGTITFNAYSTADCSGAAVFTTSLPVIGNGSYGPVGFTPAAVGTYHWIASYSGDVNNGPIAGACGDPGENDTVIPASPAINTSANETAVVIGSPVHDSATLSGGVTPTGTITFKAYSTADCSGAAVFTSTPVTVNGNGTYGPVSFVPAAVGTYHWIASYSGDAKNNPIAGACGDAGENDTVIPASPTIATVATEGGVAGDPISDTATLSGAHLPTTGTVTFNLYGRTDPTCASAPIFTSTVDIGADGTATSDPFTVTQAGNYHWIASYSGDASNDPVAGACGDENESTSIRSFNPTIATSLTSGGVTSPKITVLFGSSVTDQATLTGTSAAAGGTVTYTVYSDAECDTVFADAGTKDVVNGIVGASDPVVFPNAGTFHWQATYSGDINNAPVTSACADEVVTVTTPDINVLKLVKTNDGTFAPTSTANPGDTLTFQITVSNTGAGDAKAVPVSDDINPVLAHATYNGDCSNSCINTAGVLGWTIDVPSGGQVVLTFSVTLDDVFPLGTTELPNVVVVTGPGSNCPDASTDPDCDTNTTVKTPDIHVVKLVKTNDGTFAPTSTANPGDKLTFQITVSNTGDGDATDIPVSDDINPVLAHATYNGDCSNSCINTAGVLGWTIDIPSGGQVVLTFSVTLSNTFPLGTTELPNVVVVTGPGSNCPAPSEVEAAAVDPDCDTTTTVSVSSLLIDKSNDAPLKHIELPPPAGAVDLPTAPEGTTVTFTLNYTFGGDPVTNGTIKDVLPVGLTYVDGSATNSADLEFTFVSYTAATRTLLWTAENVDASGTVTYQAKVDIGAAKLAQPLTNVATIDSDQTEPDSDTSDVFVPAPPKVETGPPTDIEAPTTTGTPGNSLPLILAILAAIFFTVALVTPVPATARRRNRQR